MKRIYVGEGFDAEGFARHLVDNDIVDGATIIKTTGLWRAPDGQVFDEPGAIVELAFVDPSPWWALVNFTIPAWLRDHGEQSAMFTEGDGPAKFIAA